MWNTNQVKVIKKTNKFIYLDKKFPLVHHPNLNQVKEYI